MYLIRNLEVNKGIILRSAYDHNSSVPYNHYHLPFTIKFNNNAPKYNKTFKGEAV